MLPTTEKLTREQTKMHNNRFVLKTIYEKGPISRADIARATHLTATTVSTVVSEYMESGLLEEAGSITIARGKPPTLVNLVHDSAYIVGLDLARSEFQGAIMSLSGEAQAKQAIRINGQKGEDALAVVYALLDNLLSETKTPILGIGIAAPGILDADYGIVRQAVNFGWYDLPLRQLLVDKYHLPVYIANDNHVAVLAEHTFGTHKGNQDLVVLKVSHGIGAGIILNQQLFYGHRFGAGEVGHVMAVENGQECTCGNFGCLETVASSRAIIQQARQLAAQNPHSMLHQLSPNLDNLTIQDVIAAFAAADEDVQQLIREVSGYLGTAVANIVGVLGVPNVLIAGSITGFGQPLLDIIQEVIIKKSLAASVSETEVEFASLEDQIVYLGTAALVLSNELGVV